MNGCEVSRVWITNRNVSEMLIEVINIHISGVDRSVTDLCMFGNVNGLKQR